MPVIEQETGTVTVTSSTAFESAKAFEPPKTRAARLIVIFSRARRCLIVSSPFSLLNNGRSGRRL